MIFRALILLVFFTSTMAAVSSQVSQAPLSLNQKYSTAMEQATLKSSCKTFKTLGQSKDFSLRELALLRHAQNCEKNLNWAKFQHKISKDILKPFTIKAWFEYELNKKNYQQAYKIFSTNRKSINIDKKDFDQLATNALKTKLSKKDKANLRSELYRRSPRFIPRPKKDQYLKVARDFRNDRNFKKALHYYRKVINDPKMSYHLRWHAFKGARRTYKLERWSRMQKYIQSSKQWANFLKKKYKWSKELTRLHHDANIEYIRTIWTEKGQEHAWIRLNILEKELTKRYSLQLVYWLKGRMAEERKDYKESVDWLTRASKEPILTDRDQQRVLWALAWNQRRVAEYKNSQLTLERLKKSPELTFFAKTKYLYWQAENKSSLGLKNEAKGAFERLAKLDLYGYYGALAYRKLGIAFPKPPNPVIDQKDILAFFSKADKIFFKDLVSVNEFEIAEAFIQKNVRTNKKWSTEKWVAYLNLLQMAGAYKTFFYRYHTLPPKKQLAVLEEHPYLLFPQPYKKQVLISSKNTKVSPALIYSIMKQESGFDVRARSHADAFGLLQLIPQVAQKAAKRMPLVSYTQPHDLFKPSVVIPLGANSLHHLFAKFDSNFILSVAAYNASENAVKGWIQSRFNGDPITFIEDIPYEETKGYVKLVMRNYITYNRFDSNDEPFVFPEVCLQGLQSFKK